MSDGMMTSTLPAGFGELEPLCPRWAGLKSAPERYLARQACDMAELKGFYALVPMMPFALPI